MCYESEIPVFVKQLGTGLAKELGLKDRHGRDIKEFPEEWQRREMPYAHQMIEYFKIKYPEYIAEMLRNIGKEAL